MYCCGFWAGTWPPSALWAWTSGRPNHGRWRLPEKVLFLSALAGGSVGALLGMGFFRHKTRHWTFRLGMPAILILQVAALTAWTYWDVFLR